MGQARRTVHQPPVKLSDHVTAGAGPDLDTILTRVREGVAQLTEDFVAAAQGSLAEIDTALAEARAGSGQTRRAALQEIFRHAHDLRGLGGTFDYPLITHIGSSLCDLITQLEQVTDLHLEAIELHVSALKLVIAERITGDGGRQGQALSANIEVMVGKVLDQT